jgi:hypothetical protein
VRTGQEAQAEADDDPRRESVYPTSVVLQRLHDEAPTDHFTLGWLMGSLRKRSFRHRHAPAGLGRDGTGRINRSRPAAHDPRVPNDCGPACPGLSTPLRRPFLLDAALAALVQRAVPMLRYLEKVIHPRWPTPLEATKRLVGIVVVILNTTLVFTAIPLSNVVPALVIHAKKWKDRYWRSVLLWRECIRMV